MIKIPTIKKLKIKVDPHSTPQEVGDMMSKGLHMMKDFEHEMHHHPFGHKLISIGKPLMFGGLHNALGMMDPEMMHHMCHHKGHHACKHMINNIIKRIILFLIWKIFESIDNRCCGMCENECIRKFKNDLNECYSKISKVNSLLNESSLVLTDEHKIAIRVKGLELLEEDLKTKVENIKKKVKAKVKSVPKVLTKGLKIGAVVGTMGLSLYGDHKINKNMMNKLDMKLPDNVIVQVLKSTEETSKQHKLFLQLQKEKDWLKTHDYENSPVSSVVLSTINHYVKDGGTDDSSSRALSKAIAYSSLYNDFFKHVDSPEVQKTLSFLNINIPVPQNKKASRHDNVSLEKSNVKTIWDDIK